MTSGKTDHLIRIYLNSAVALLDSLLDGERLRDPESFAEIDRALAAGSMLNLHACLAPTTGLCVLDIALHEPNGKAHPLLSIELQRQQGAAQ